MVNMKRNVLLIPFVAAVAMMLVGFASANLAGSIDTEFNGVSLGYNTVIAGSVNDVIPVKVTFDAWNDASDVRVKVYMEGNREDISASTSRFDIEYGKTYTKLLSLKLPSDADDLSEEYTLYVEVVSKNDRSEREYTISLQRESYTFEVLSADYSSKVSAGDVVPVSVVVKNSGYNRMDDAFVVVSIPELGVSTRGYVGDLIPTESYVDYEDEEDSMVRTVYLNIPTDAKAGVYEMNVMVYNDDAKSSKTALISVGSATSNTVLASANSKDLSAGETITYDMVIVNSANSVKAFNIKTVSGDFLSVSAPSVVTVGPDASETITVMVRASDNAPVGTYTFSVDVDGKQAVFGANVVEGSTSASVVALTVVLVIVFIVLLAILVILLTKKEKPMEEVETSYY